MFLNDYRIFPRLEYFALENLAFACLLSGLVSLSCSTPAATSEAATILNVSYDPTREFYQEFNPLFTKHWKEATGKSISIRMSHGGAGKQARSVMDGLEADVVTLALEYDINAIAQKGLIAPKWRGTLPNQNAPYTSTVVFLVRKGNPRLIKDWSDLVRPEVKVITPNPKTSGGARWNYLAAYAYAIQTTKTEEGARDFLRRLFKNVPILDSGARGATNTFVERKIGDVLLTWENEALMALEQSGSGEYQIVYPSFSIVAEPPVAVVDKNCKSHHSCDVSMAYLRFLYTKDAQLLVGKHHFRPYLKEAFQQYKHKFPVIPMTTVDALAGNWDMAQKKHFADDGEFDQIYSGVSK